jgi:hypothetical protein
MSFYAAVRLDADVKPQSTKFWAVITDVFCGLVDSGCDLRHLPKFAIDKIIVNTAKRYGLNYIVSGGFLCVFRNFSCMIHDQFPKASFLFDRQMGSVRAAVCSVRILKENL